MRRLWLVLLLFGCSDSDEAAVEPLTVVEQGREQPARARPTRSEQVRRAAPTRTPASNAEDELIALRRYEQLLNGRRAATIEVRWTRFLKDGRELVKDVTRMRSQSARMMGRIQTVFKSETTSTTIRTESGEMISQETVVVAPSRTDIFRIERTKTGYRVQRELDVKRGRPEDRLEFGPNAESFEFNTDGAAMVDAEAFLAQKIAAGEAKPGMTWKMPLLFADRRTLVEATLTIVGPDEEGPGLKVIQNLEGSDTLWWFDRDGAVVRLRSGITVTARDDSVGLDDLPARPASWRITLPANVHLPRIFTGKTMLVDIEVETDETTTAPRIPENPFTETVKREDGLLRALLKSYDDPSATTSLPIDPSGFEEHLKATPLMEVDDPVLIEQAKRIVGDETDARVAAGKIADFVFRNLEMGSPDIGQPSCKAILRDRIGDCSEHALLFTGLCRAAGIPARLCSGYVCIGGDWGSHAWCEIWVGRWIGADPTTNEIGTRARYIFLSRPDDPNMTPGRLTAERTRILIRQVEYDDGKLDFENGKIDPTVLSGIRVADLPDGWSISRDRGAFAIITNGDFTLWAGISPDHGYRSLAILSRRFMGAKQKKLGRRDAVYGSDRSRSTWIVPLGRQNLLIQIRGDAPSAEVLAAVLKPTLDRED